MVKQGSSGKHSDKSFAYHTKTNLGGNLLYVFNEGVRQYLQNAASDLGPQMTGLSAYDGFGPSSNVHTVLTLDELHFRASMFNLLTGRADSALLRLSVANKDEQGRGIIDVISQLPFDKHVEFLGGLIAALGRSKSVG